MRTIIGVAAATLAVISCGQQLKPVSGPIHYSTRSIGGGGVSSQSTWDTVYQTSQLLPMQYLSDATANGQVIDDLHFQGLQLNSLGWAEIKSITFGYYAQGVGSLDLELTLYDDNGLGGSTVGPLNADFVVPGVPGGGTNFITLNFTGSPVTVIGPLNWMGLHFYDYAGGVTDAGWIVANSPPIIGSSADLYVDGTGTTIYSPWSGSSGPKANFDPIIQATPEPSTMAIALFGFLGMFVRGRRRRAHLSVPWSG